MDQDTSGKSGSRSWRDRLGIDEGKPSGGDTASTRAEPALQPSAPAQAKPAAPKVQSKVVARPAPMAPRPGTAAKAPPAPRPAPQPERAAQDDAFAERLRKHREAAEEAVKKRAGTASLEKFSFAKKEVEVAQAEKAKPAPVPAAPAQPPAAPPPQAPAAAPAPAPRPVPAPAPRPAPPAPAPRAAGAPMQRPMPQAAPPQQPAYRPQQPGYPGAQQPPAYRPPGPGYAPPPAAGAAPPQGYAPAGQHGYGAPVAPAPRSPAPPAPGYPPAPHGDDDLFQDNGYRPAAPLGRPSPDALQPKQGQDLRAGFDDPFDDNLAGGYGGRTARDYSQAYREFDDDYEDDEPRRGWGGLIMLILALLFIGALAVGGVLWWQSQTNTAGGTSGSQVPQVAAPDQPAKAEPDAAQPSQTGAPPQGRKLIYERLLSDDSAPQPEQIVPREEAPVVPPPSGNTGGDSLPLPLPPPPQNSGSLQPGPGAAEPAAQQVASTDTRDNQEGAAGVEPAASAVSRQGITNPPIPRRKPRNLVASVQNSPTTQFQPVLQPSPQPVPQPQPLPAPQELPQLGQPAVPQQGTIAQPPQPQLAQPEPVRTRSAVRDDDPLAGARRPFNSSTAPQQQPSGPLNLAPSTAQQQVALAPPPAAAPVPSPQPQQPVTSQDLQAFAPPAPSQRQASAPQGSGYVIQLAAYRSEQEAMAQYQQLKARHGTLLGNLPPSVQQTNLGASGTFYRLGMGPVNSKITATDLCNKLIAAGERDCLVRRR
jgi:cell division septation protein DedD